MNAIKHALIRVYLYILLILFCVTFGLAVVPLAPLYKAAFAPRASLKELSFFPIWTHVYRIIWRSLTDK
jgi:hypothetical protein